MEALLARPMTAEEFMELPAPMDGTEQELVRGKVVSMSLPKPPHGFVCSKIDRKIGIYSDEHHLGTVLSNDTGVIVDRNPDTVRGPDVAFWSYARLPKLPADYIEIAPDLAVEVVSPGNTHVELQAKIKEYFFHGTRRVWLVYPLFRMVSVYRDPATNQSLSEIEYLDGEDILPGFRCLIGDLFPPKE